MGDKPCLTTGTRGMIPCSSCHLLRALSAVSVVTRWQIIYHLEHIALSVPAVCGETFLLPYDTYDHVLWLLLGV